MSFRQLVPRSRTVLVTLAAGLVPVLSGVMVNGLSEDQGVGPFAPIMQHPMVSLVLFVILLIVIVLRREAASAAEDDTPSPEAGVPGPTEVAELRNHLVEAVRHQLSERRTTGNSPIPLIDVKLRVTDDNGELRTIDGRHRTLADAGRRVLVTGAPGAGKSEQLRLHAELLLRSFEGQGRRRRRKEARTLSARVPLLLALDTWTGAEKSFTSWAAGAIAQRYGLSREEARLWLDHGTYCLLLDGLDEVPAPVRHALVDALVAFAPERARLEIVVAHRAVCGQASGFHQLTRWWTVHLEPLTPEQVSRYADAHADVLGEAWRALRSDPDLRQVVDSPLFLVLAAEGLRDGHGGPAGRRELIEAFVRVAVCGRGDPADEPAARRRLDGLKRIARFLQRTGAVGFCPDQLVTHAGLRRWQRVLCCWALPVALATAICLVTVVVMQVANTIGHGMSFGFDVGRSATADIGTDVGVVLALAVLVRLIGVRPAPAGGLSWGTKALRKRRILVGSYAVLVSVAVGVASGSLAAGLAGTAAGWQAGLVNGTVTLGIAAIAFALLGGLHTPGTGSVRRLSGGGRSRSALPVSRSGSSAYQRC